MAPGACLTGDGRTGAHEALTGACDTGAHCNAPLRRAITNGATGDGCYEQRTDFYERREETQDIASLHGARVMDYPLFININISIFMTTSTISPVITPAIELAPAAAVPVSVTTSPQKGRWYFDLMSRVNTLAEELGLDDISSSKLRELLFSVAKSQYMAGNKSGIRWARQTSSQDARTHALNVVATAAGVA